MGHVRKLMVNAQNDGTGAAFGNFLRSLSEVVRASVLRGGTDPAMISAHLRATVNELEELAYELGAVDERNAPPALRLVTAPSVIATPVPSSVIGGWGVAAAAPPTQLPPNSLPRLAIDEAEQVRANEPLPGENPIQDLHRRALSGFRA